MRVSAETIKEMAIFVVRSRPRDFCLKTAEAFIEGTTIEVMAPTEAMVLTFVEGFVMDAERRGREALLKGE